MAKPLDFKDFVVVDYRPGEVDSVKYAAQKRHKQQAKSESVEVEEGVRGYNPGWMLKADPKLGAAVKAKQDLAKKRQATYGKPEAGKSVKKEEVDEALTVMQRLQRKRQMVRNKAKITLGKERAKRRMANPEKLSKRSMKQARMAVFKKLTKDVPKDELSYARRQEIEKRLDKPAVKARIKQIARKLLPQVRKKEIERRKNISSQ